LSRIDEKHGNRAAAVRIIFRRSVPAVIVFGVTGAIQALSEARPGAGQEIRGGGDENGGKARGGALN